MNASQPYQEHLVSYQGSNISVRHYAGTGPTFVLMHGFPDNLHIYDRLIPALHGRQVLTFDFLGWGASDTNLRSEWYNKGNDERGEEDLFWERESHEPQLIIQLKKSNVA